MERDGKRQVLNGNRRFTFPEYEMVCWAIGVNTDKFLQPRMPTEGRERMADIELINNNDLSLKEVINIFNRIDDKGREKILSLSRDILSVSLSADQCVERNSEIETRSKKEFENLERSCRISTRATDFEKSMTLLKIIAEKMDFKEKFRMCIEYDPELLRASIEFFTMVEGG